MEIVNRILELKKIHLCKNIVELSKIIDVYKQYYDTKVMYDSEYIHNGKLFMPKTITATLLSRIDRDVSSYKFKEIPYNIFNYHMENNINHMSRVIENNVDRNMFMRGLLTSCRYDEVNSLLDTPPEKFGLKSYEFEFKEEILICDENIYNRIVNLCTDIKPIYKPITEFWYKYKVRATDWKLVEYLFMLRNYDILKQLKKTHLNDIIQAINNTKIENMSYEFYRTFNKFIQDVPSNLANIEYFRLKQRINSNPQISVKRSIMLFLGGKKFEHPTKEDITNNMSHILSNYSHNPYVVYKLGKYIHHMQLSISDINEYKYTSFDDLYKRNYVLFDNNILNYHCGDELVVEKIAKYLHPMLIEVHTYTCTKVGCLLAKHHIKGTKRA